MTIAPELRTDRLVLAPVRRRDALFLWRLLGDAKVRQFLGGPVPRRHRFARIRGNLRGHPKVGLWVVRGRAAAMGMIVLSPHHDGAEYELSYMFSPAFWGHGFAREAAGRVVEHAFADLGLPKIIAETQSANAASCRLLQALGFSEQKRLERFGAQQVVFVKTAVARCSEV